MNETSHTQWLGRAKKDLTNLRAEIEPLQHEHLIQSEEIKRLQERKDNADKLAAEQNKMLTALRDDYKTVEVRVLSHGPFILPSLLSHSFVRIELYYV
jgi:hypothetical protein